MIWRPSKVEQFICVIAGTGLLAIGIAVITYDFGDGLHFDQVVMSSLLGLAGFGMQFHVIFSRIALTAMTVEVRNFLVSRTIPVAEIRSVEPERSGMIITTSDGKRINGMALQKGRGSDWLGTYTRADEAADAIRRAAGLSVRRSLPKND